MKTSSINQDPCVLIVDDHAISRHHSVKALRQITNRVKQARNGSEAVEFALSMLPDLILMDISLPDTSGLTVLSQIRQAWPQDHTWPAVVILSGDISRIANPNSRANTIGIGINIGAVLLKPARLQDIRDTAMRLLHLDQGVQEQADPISPQTIDAGLRMIFLQELDFRLPELDQEISSLNWPSAAGILHQLIASSAMCAENSLELRCRHLHRILAEDPEASSVAQAYYAFLKAVDVVRMPHPA